MPQCDFDVLVLGAGPAGSAAAALARKRGFRVGLVEKARFPRFRIGESLLPNGNALLREIGVWPKIEAAGFVKKHGALFTTADGRFRKEVWFTQGLVRGLDYTYQVERSRFDALLLEHARELGAEVLEGCTARSVETGPEAAQAVIAGADGERTVHARWILDATGRESTCASALKRELDPPRLPRRLAVYSHFEGVVRPEGEAAGHTVVVRLADGWFWLIPLTATKTSVGLVTSAAALRAEKGGPAALFQKVVEASPQLRVLLGQARPTLEFQVTADYSYFRRRLAHGRQLLIGDAGGFFDPIFSSGVYVALYSARRAVDLLARADAKNRALRPSECRRYTRELKRHAGVFEKLIHAFYDNDSFSIFMSPRPPCQADRAVNSIVAGHARLSWRLWWRFHLFLTACRVQKRFRIAESIAFDRVPSVASAAGGELRNEAPCVSSPHS